MVVSLVLNIFHFFALGRLKFGFSEHLKASQKSRNAETCGSVVTYGLLMARPDSLLPSTFESSCWGSESQGSNVGKAMHTPGGLWWTGWWSRGSLSPEGIWHTPTNTLPMLSSEGSKDLSLEIDFSDPQSIYLISIPKLAAPWQPMLLPQLSRTVVAKTSRFRRLRSCAQLKTLAQKPTKAWAMMLTSRRWMAKVTYPQHPSLKHSNRRPFGWRNMSKLITKDH